MSCFDYVRLGEKDRNKLEVILQEIEKLNNAKLRYSVQELQSLDVLSNSPKKIERVLQGANRFLNSATNFGELEEVSPWERRELGEYLEKKDLHQDIEIDVDSLRAKVNTLVDIAFKANKYTKLLCKYAIDAIKKGNEELVGILKSVYKKVHAEDMKRISVNDGLEGITETTAYKKWKRECYNGTLKDDKQILRQLYDDCAGVWDLESVLYEVKNQSNKGLVRCLIKDNYKEFKDWGFSRDEEGKWVLNLDPDDVIIRYASHVPDLKRILSENLLRSIVDANGLQYNNRFNSQLKKQNLDRIRSDAREIYYDDNKRKIVGLLRKPYISLELYIIAKKLIKNDMKKIKEEYPELKQRCEDLEELISPQAQREIETVLEENESVFQNTEHEKTMRRQIEQTLLEHRTILVQERTKLRHKCVYICIKKTYER